MERAAAVAMSTLNAVSCILFQFSVVVSGKLISSSGKIVILVDQADVKPSGTGRTMIAVDTMAIRILWGKCANDGIVSFFL